MVFRLIFISSFLFIIAGGIGYLFWEQEIQYRLPTPIPKNYTSVASLETVPLQGLLPGREEEKAILLHFFNPDCPCSRFNSKHFESLYRDYSKSVEFFAVVPEYSSAEAAKEYLPEGIRIITDANEALAKACGVYSSPQAALITPENTLYYRGNYNKSRYCTQPATNYVAQALENYTSGKAPQAFGQLATTAYGCSLYGDPTTFLLLSL